MNGPEPKDSKDRWWRDFLIYGGATHIPWIPMLVIFLVMGVIILPSLSKMRRSIAARTVVLYCAQDQFFAEPLLADFTAQTGIRVKPVFDSEAVKTVGLANRLLAERSNPVCDVFWGNEEFRTRQLAEAGVFLPTDGWSAFGHRSRQLVIATNAPPGTSLPSSLLELTNAHYRGRVSLAFPLFGTTATHLLVLRQHWGESNWVSWCRALMANTPFLEEGNSQVVKRVARGEAWVGLTDSDDILAGQREGLPIAARSLGAESLLLPNTVGLVARKDPPSKAALRLVEYLRSPEVRSALMAAGALENDGEPGGALVPDWPRVLAEREGATQQLKEIFAR
jgi:iron(III) transport system substrate-binding protein